MARYVKTVDIWTLSDDERAKLQPGQWVRAGHDGANGRFFGQGNAATACAWLGNAKGRYKSYMSFMASYGRNMRNNARPTA